MQSIARNFKKTIFLSALALGLMVPLFAGSAAHAELFPGAKGEACDAVGAAKNGGGNNNSCDYDDNGPLAKSEGQLAGTLTKVLNLLTVVIGLISVIMIIISGVKFVTSGGDSNSISAAKNTLIYALVGLILVAFAQIIVKLVLTRIS